MPLVVEISVAFSILIAFIVIGIFLFRIRERFDTVDLRRSTRSAANDDERTGRSCSSPLLAAVGAAAVPALSGCPRRINMLASLVSFLAVRARCSGDRPAPGQYLLIDDLNVVFIVLNTFVGFTTSAFSASYIGHELETGRLTPGYLRFYHAMYQVMLFGMNLALIANNIGLMWVAVELATLTHRDDGRHLPHARSDRGRLEILHPRQRRHRARAVRHHPGLLSPPAR